jgi:hypothetical protein
MSDVCSRTSLPPRSCCVVPSCQYAAMPPVAQETVPPSRGRRTQPARWSSAGRRSPPRDRPSAIAPWTAPDRSARPLEQGRGPSPTAGAAAAWSSHRGHRRGPVLAVQSGEVLGPRWRLAPPRAGSHPSPRRPGAASGSSGHLHVQCHRRVPDIRRIDVGNPDLHPRPRPADRGALRRCRTVRLSVPVITTPTDIACRRVRAAMC